MSKRNILFVLAVAGGLVVMVGAVFVTTWEVPRPTAQIEKVIPNERFAR
ncbi:MAG: hypothetical protein OEU09_02190 [Rhodospirillales bacterium]|nr:hypothetical protein [Rhodospirillales bacterium]MDH3965605.1 hypothetical protein [Rhodospirillales bacterium]